MKTYGYGFIKDDAKQLAIAANVTVEEADMAIQSFLIPMIEKQIEVLWEDTITYAEKVKALQDSMNTKLCARSNDDN